MSAPKSYYRNYPRLDGARKLEEYLVNNSLSLKEFAKASGLATGTIYRILIGHGKRPRKNTVTVVDKFTNGHITAADWESDTYVLDVTEQVA